MNTCTLRTVSGSYRISLAFLLGLVLALPGHANVLDSWDFDVYLDDRKIGYHQFELTGVDDTFNGTLKGAFKGALKGNYEVSTRAEFDVKVLFVNFYRYRHENKETWRAGCLQDIRAKTDANGSEYQVQGEVVSSEFLVNTGSETTQLPECVKTFAYWDPEFLRETQLLNSQTGAYERVTVEKVGEEEIEIQNALVPAVHYRLLAETGPVSLWYGIADNRWLALQSIAEGGRVIRYELQASRQGHASD